jgi:hypothetical protein
MHRTGRRPLAPWLLAAAALLSVTVGREAAAGEVPSKRHRDAVHKFSFKVFQDWDPVPIETGEKYEVCKYVERGDRGRDAPRVHVFRLATGAAAAPVTTSTDGTPPTEEPRSPDDFEDRMRGVPKDMVELLNREIGNYMFQEKISASAGKAVETRDDVPGKTWAINARHPFGGYYMVFAAWKKGDVELGMWLRCEENQKRKYEQGFKAVVSSFTWHDEKAKDVESLDVLDGVNITPKKRREIERGLVRGWNVIVSPKKNYVVIYNTKGKRNDFLAKTIAKNIEAIREQIYEVQFPPSKPIDAVSVCRVCGDRMEYHAYGGPGGSAGYWSSATEELVFYDASPSRKVDDDTLAVLYHEAFHQYIYYSVGEFAPHSWFNEGHGDYYAGAKYKGGKFRIGPFDWRVGLVKSAIRSGPCSYEETKRPDGSRERKWERSGGGYSPIEALVDMSQGEYYSYPGVSYAQGWSLVYFLREIVPKNRKWNEKWGKILPTYFDVLKEEVAKARGKETPPAGPPEKPDEPEPPEDPKEPGPDEDPKGPGDEPPAEPTDPGDEPPPPPDNPEDFQGFAPQQMREDVSALRRALEKAFEGVDFAELEEAWRESILKVPG